MRIQGKARSVRQLAVVGLVASTILISTPASAGGSGCLPAPTLDGSHQSSALSLGSGVIATSWTWQPGDDAQHAALSPLGAKFSVVEGDLRDIDFGILHWAIPQTKSLKDLSQGSELALGSLNGDYFDGNGPWNAMIENSEVSYSPPGTSGVVGMALHKVVPSKGYRSTGTLTIGTKKYQVTGVNQPNPGSESLVVYGALSGTQIPVKGQTTIVLRAGAIYKIYPKGAAINVALGTVIQVRGAFASELAKLRAKTKVKLSLARAPLYETQMAADSIKTAGSISNNNATLIFESVNYANQSVTGATLFDENFSGKPYKATATLRLALDDLGRYYVKNVYRTGASIAVQSGELIVQARGSAALSVKKFKAGDLVVVKAGYQSNDKTSFISAAGRGPRLVENGKFIWVCAQHAKDYRPRSAIGWNDDGKVWLVASSRGQDAVDLGFRQGGSSSDQIGHWLMALGATNAVLLDGGGSTTVEIKNPATGWQRMDIPDSGWYRELANAFSIQVKG